VQSSLSGMLAGMASGCGLMFSLHKHLGPGWTIALGISTWIIVGSVIVKLTMRLDPKDR
jgi:hypothetical protein